MSHSDGPFFLSRPGAGLTGLVEGEYEPDGPGTVPGAVPGVVPGAVPGETPGLRPGEAPGDGTAVMFAVLVVASNVNINPLLV